jgi:KaiC/GvpD/RAD55 family RecA-like ATPase
MGDRTQEIVNRQVVRDCDILIGVFWTRLGSPTGKAESGTVEEIREFIATGKPVMLYFSKVRAALDDVDMEQWQKVKSFQTECQSKGLVYTYETIDELRDLLRSHIGRTIQKLNTENSNIRALQPLPVSDTETEQMRAIRSFSADFAAFLRKSDAAWDAEKESNPHSIDEGKYVLNQIADELIEYRSRITKDSGQLSTVLADATKRIKSLQRYQVYLDGGVSFREFWNQGDDILFLIEIVPALLEDAIEDGKAGERESLIRAAIEDLKFNQQHLASLEYSTVLILQTKQLDSLLNEEIPLPRRLLMSLGIYSRSVKSARDVHQITTGEGDTTPELIKIEQLLHAAQCSGEAAIRDLASFCHYRYGDRPVSAQGAPR